MRTTAKSMCWVFALLSACLDRFDAANGDATTADLSGPEASTTTSSSPTSSVDDGGSQAASSGEMTTTVPASSGSGLGDTDACSPLVPGEWNTCHDGTGSVDTTLCNWIGDPDATGFIGCLVSSEMEEYNSCFISGCDDACDCFAPPPTGTAVVECAEILAAGGTGCHLNCGGGATCPDGMECIGLSCFWPPSG